MTKKLIAPIIITILLIAYFIFYAAIIVYIPDMPIVVKILGIVIPVTLAGVSIYVLVERIKEIRSGEEDDLSKY